MRYLMTFSYDGTNYNGYQKQPNKNTIQDKIEDALKQINNDKCINISATGRTDAKVHALNQKAHFDLEKEIDTDKLKRALNSLTPDDIYIKKIEEVDNDFHARFDIKKKTYIYKINIGEYNPLDRNYIYQYNQSLNIEKMREALSYFIGTHNFKSFTKNNDEITDYVRTIIDTNLEVNNNIITLTFTGTGFLRYMVRNIVGTLIEIGEEKLKPEQVKEILLSEDRTEAGKTANPEGLYLKDVYYE